LGGFHAALLMKRQRMQLPVGDTLGLNNGLLLNRFSNEIMPAAVAGENTHSPLPLNSYNPLRAGWMRLNRLWVVDVFGQKIELTPAPTAGLRAASLVPYGDNPQDPFVGLPPRITQAARLLFRWLSAADDVAEMNSDPATTPVFGWVLFNHLD